MKRESGKLVITAKGKLILTGEVFDSHGSYPFDAFVDTGSDFGLVLTQELADAVCAKVEGEINISIGGGSQSIVGQKRKVSLKFGEMAVTDYEVTVISGTRNLIGIKFLQDANILMVADFKPGKTSGGIITNNRKYASIIGKAAHCAFSHQIDITGSHLPCPICGARGK
jgi:predicted oxidoreductase